MSTQTQPASASNIVDPMTNEALTKTQQPGIYQRVQTSWRSFCTLKDLTPEQVDSFMKSYVIYDLDWKNEKQMIEVLGPNYQQEVGRCLSDYYGVLNHLCAIGELEKMYVPPIMNPEFGIMGNQLLYEELIIEELQLLANAKVLDIGCGRGRVAAHMTDMTGAKVSGLNIDKDQIASAIAFNELMKHDNTFVRRDMNDQPWPFEDEEFDGFYQIQAFSLCKDLDQTCRELYRVLKPGARLSLLDWVSLDAYNPEDAHHRDLMREVKPIIGAVGTPTPQSMVESLEQAGFRMVRHYQPSHEGIQAPLLERAKTYFFTARWLMHNLVYWKVLPAHLGTLFNRLNQGADSFIEADRSKLITTCYHWVAEKPASSNGAPAKTASPASSSSDTDGKQTDTPPSSDESIAGTQRGLSK
ncbi:hypothetical protein LTR78_007545 [Recurvomyces mirabilis]|uniref:Methyltransferase type 11 domain-containing protein n=1 Tax=Recurvomyces mirabilis TaxID=574656 RepID=A0AAE0TSF0_9PEZI|nr:hypothetical protein LTR78_007545 [Recurvomyces mirabilis]KAK5159944.1 hypothetical protein LTS14_002050 [Recurvomyces mirabilis]